MSKSYKNQIDLTEHPDTVRKKVSKMFTDPKRIKRDDPGHPDDCNVCSYWKVFSPDDADHIAEDCRSAKTGCVDCKKMLAEKLIEYMAPVREKYIDNLANKDMLRKILDKGRDRAREVTGETMKQVHEALGF